MKIELQNIDTSDLVRVRKYPGKKSDMTKLREFWAHTAEPNWDEVYEAARERQLEYLAGQGFSDCKMFSEAEERLDARTGKHTDGSDSELDKLDAVYWHRERMARISAGQGEN